MRGRSPIKKARMCQSAIKRLRDSNSNLFINVFMHRSRSAYFEIIAAQAEKHPLYDSRYEGVTVYQYVLMLRRNGDVKYGTSGLAHITWHALGRMRERSRIDIFEAGGVAGMCGIAGLLMRESAKHHNTQLNLTLENMMCTGVLRVAKDEDGYPYGFFDVLTVLDADGAVLKQARYAQGCWVGNAAMKYIRGDDADPDGYADDIPVLPFHETDFVSRELRARLPTAESNAQ
jgi:hypothetical protein